MFYCEKCRKKKKWPVSLCKSRGACEVCLRITNCHDVKSKHLPLPPNPQHGCEPDKVKSHPDKAKRQDCADCLYPERSCSECINKAREPKPLAQYLDEYIEHEVELENISPEIAELFAYDSWRDLLEQALGAYQSTENVTIKIERNVE